MLSIVLPTYNRASLLRQSLESTLRNDFRTFEIVISEDGPPDRRIEEIIKDIKRCHAIDIKHVANTGPKGQAGNVLNGLANATYELVVLMHDDDLFVDGGVDALMTKWSSYDGQVDALYGFQYVADANGRVDKIATISNNKSYFREQKYVGSQRSNLWAALVGQFPNNGFLVRRSLALLAGYPNEREVGRAPVDYHFGIRYAQVSTRPFVLIPEYVTVYRRSEVSVARTPKTMRSRLLGSTRDGHLSWEALETVTPTCPLDEHGLRLAKERAAPAAVEGYLAVGKRDEALRILRRYGRALQRRPRWWMKIALQFALASMPAFARPRSAER